MPFIPLAYAAKSQYLLAECAVTPEAIIDRLALMRAPREPAGPETVVSVPAEAVDRAVASAGEALTRAVCEVGVNG